MIIDMDALVRSAVGLNPWWAGRPPPDRFRREHWRYATRTLSRRLAEPSGRALFLLGPRQVGKTTALHQCIGGLLGRGVAPRSVLYLSGDEAELQLDSFGEVLAAVEQGILWPEGPRYLFLDEVQRIPQWDLGIKRLVDRDARWRVVATGSAAGGLVRGARESGAGRVDVIRMPALLFHEYLALRGIRPGVEAPALADLLDMDETALRAACTAQAELDAPLVAYLVAGGFPALVDRPPAEARRLLRQDFLDRVLERDLPAQYPLRNPLAAKRIAYLLAMEPGRRTTADGWVTDLGADAGVSPATLSQYIGFLEDAQLIFRFPAWSRGGGRSTRTPPRIYLAHPCIEWAFRPLAAPFPSEGILSPDPSHLGGCAESAAALHLRALAHLTDVEIEYFREGRHEVDFVATGLRAAALVPIEVKFREQLRGTDLAPISRFLTSQGASQGVVLVRRPADAGDAPICGTQAALPFFSAKSLRKVPLPTALLALGRAVEALSLGDVAPHGLLPSSPGPAPAPRRRPAARAAAGEAGAARRTEVPPTRTRQAAVEVARRMARASDGGVFTGSPRTWMEELGVSSGPTWRELYALGVRRVRGRGAEARWTVPAELGR